jgi:pyruvate/2-oxoglutarate dehydrogenase complex dihydrolipoamide dehydrogenase (E3) component
VGRSANTKFLNLSKLGIETNQSNNKILPNKSAEFEQTSVQKIYAIGDVL